MARVGSLILFESDETFFEALYVRRPKLSGTELIFFVESGAKE
jgi:hypothetical protein